MDETSSWNCYLYLLFLQPSSSGVPGSPTIHLPVKLRVWAKLQKWLVIKVNLLAVTVNIWLD